MDDNEPELRVEASIQQIEAVFERLQAVNGSETRVYRGQIMCSGSYFEARDFSVSFPLCDIG